MINTLDQPGNLDQFETIAIRFDIPVNRVDLETREVWGVMVTDAPLPDGKILPFEASCRAAQEWVSRRGNMREMHQPIAAGKAVAIRIDEDIHGIWLGSRVSDGADSTWLKIQDGTLRSYSVNAVADKRNTHKERREIDGRYAEFTVFDEYVIREVSYVDVGLDPVSNDAGLVFRGEGFTDLIADGELEPPADLAAGTTQQESKRMELVLTVPDTMDEAAVTVLRSLWEEMVSKPPVERTEPTVDPNLETERAEETGAGAVDEREAGVRARAESVGPEGGASDPEHDPAGTSHAVARSDRPAFKELFDRAETLLSEGKTLSETIAELTTARAELVATRDESAAAEITQIDQARQALSIIVSLIAQEVTELPPEGAEQEIYDAYCLMRVAEGIQAFIASERWELIDMAARADGLTTDLSKLLERVERLEAAQVPGEDSTQRSAVDHGEEIQALRQELDSTVAKFNKWLDEPDPNQTVPFGRGVTGDSDSPAKFEEEVMRMARTPGMTDDQMDQRVAGLIANMPVDQRDRASLYWASLQMHEVHAVRGA